MSAKRRTPAVDSRTRAGASTRRRTPKRERDPEDKRERILAAARDLFARRGYGATGTWEIARAAKVSEGLIFLYFDSKQGILKRIATDYGRGMAEAMETAVASDTDAASACVRATFQYVRERGLLHQLFQVARDPADDGAALGGMRGEVVAMLTRMLQELKEHGKADFADASMSASLVFGLVQSALLECFAHERGAREQEWVATCAGWLRAALGMR